MKRIEFAVLVVVLLALAGCAPTPAPTPTPKVRYAPDIDYRAALAALDTYRARASLDIYPAKETGLNKGHLEVEVDAVNRPERARRTTIRGLRSMAKPEERRRTSDVLKFVEVGGDLYMSTGVTWLKTPAQNNPEQGILDPALLIPDPTLFTLAEQAVRVNGVVANRYTFSDPRALAYLTTPEQETITDLQGQVWLAREGNFIVRYRAVARGTAFRFDMSPQPFAGRLEVAYDIYGPNEPLTITRPQTALGENPTPESEKPVVLDGFNGSPFPLPEDAAVVMSTRQVVILNTALSPEEVRRFYAQALANAGWEEGDQTGTSRGGIRATWRREGFELRLTIVPGKKSNEPTHVTVGVNPRP